jgi:hypothetical protein
MGDAFYAFLVHIFTNTFNAHLGPQRIVSHALSDLAIAFSYFWIVGVMGFIATKSVLFRRTTLMYVFALFFALCGASHLAHLFYLPLPIDLALDFVSAATATLTATFMFQRRHFILSAIYQFKYVVGLLKTLEKLDEVDPQP